MMGLVVLQLANAKPKFFMSGFQTNPVFLSNLLYFILEWTFLESLQVNWHAFAPFLLNLQQSNIFCRILLSESLFPLSEEGK